MNPLASIGLAVATLFGQPQAAPPVPTIRMPSPIIAKPLTADAKAQNVRYNSCRAAAHGQNYLPQPAIWRISDKDTNVYLFGSFHLLPAGFDWRSAQFNEIVAKSDKLVLESVNADAKPATPTLAPSPLPPMRERLTGERRAKWVGMSLFVPSATIARIDRVPDARAALDIEILPVRTNALSMGLSSGVEAQLRVDF